jgi:hypothetical protein
MSEKKPIIELRNVYRSFEKEREEIPVCKILTSMSTPLKLFAWWVKVAVAKQQLAKSSLVC